MGSYWYIISKIYTLNKKKTVPKDLSSIFNKKVIE